MPAALSVEAKLCRLPLWARFDEETYEGCRKFFLKEEKKKKREKKQKMLLLKKGGNEKKKKKKQPTRLTSAKQDNIKTLKVKK